MPRKLKPSTKLAVHEAAERHAPNGIGIVVRPGFVRAITRKDALAALFDRMESSTIDVSAWSDEPQWSDE